MKKRLTFTLISFSAIVLMLLMPQTTWADDFPGQYKNLNDAFTWYEKGPGCIHFTLLLYDNDSKTRLEHGEFTLLDENNNKINLLDIKVNIGDVHDSEVWANYTYHLAGPNSCLFLTNDPGRQPQGYVGNDGGRHRTSRVAEMDGYAEMDWYYPVEYAGRNLTFCADFISAEHKYASYQELGTINFDPINFETYDPIPGTQDGQQGSLLIPFSCDRPIKSIGVTYTDTDGIVQITPTQSFTTNTYSGTFPIPCTTKHDKLSIHAKVVSASWTNNPQGYNYPTSVEGTISRDLGNVGLIHDPKLLTATVDSEGSVVLKWKIGDVGIKDILDGDFFQIQRSLTGKEEDFKDLSSEIIFDTNQEEYEFKDSLFVSSLSAEQIDQKLGIPLVRYRVMRAAAYSLWGADYNPTIAYVQPQFSTLSLLKPQNATAEWEDREEHTVLVKWDYTASNDSVTYVWDPRAIMKVEVKMFNNDGDIVDSVVTKLSDEQRITRQVELILNRSCVKYQISLMVEGDNSPIGKGTGDIFHVINNLNDYVDFVYGTNEGSSDLSERNAILTSDISLNYGTTSPPDFELIGSYDNRPYRGNFNGNGHKLIADITSGNGTPFVGISDGAVITNLIVEGYKTGKQKYCSGLVSNVKGGHCFIENCIVGGKLEFLAHPDASSGGLVGIIYGDTINPTNLRITNSLLCASIKTPNMNIGGFIGWKQAAAFTKLSNSYIGLAESESSFDQEDTPASFMRCYTNNSIWGIVDGCGYNSNFGRMIPIELLLRTKLQGIPTDDYPDNWCWENNQPVIAQKKFSVATAGNTTLVTVPDSAFYFSNTGYAIANSLQAHTLQSSVLLTWDITENGAVDYFEVKRKIEGTTQWQVIATKLTDTQYEDKTVRPIYNYVYKVSSNTDCEGLKTKETDEVVGHCVQTGMVEGYLRFADGTGIAGKTIEIVNQDDKTKTYRTTTDESGYFKIDELPCYLNDHDVVSYHISPVDIPSSVDEQAIPFSTEVGGNLVSNVVFIITESVHFTGLVMYTGTSIPVKDVSFLVDGREVHTASGKVVTNYEGKFSFRFLPGVHSIQAVKAGHVFYQDGYYHADDDVSKTQYDLSTDKADIYFYDDTRVTLIGRVAGGDNQGNLPLNNSLSTNNLGDDLRMILSLEGDNASRLVFDTQDRSKKERDEVFQHVSNESTSNVYQTIVHTTEHRMEIFPDERTGEYLVKLPPVKWKIMQITAQGYANLFQEGKIADVIDLTDSLTLHTGHYSGEWQALDGSPVKEVDVSYHAQYNRIYHSPVQIDYKQVGFENFDYFGEHYYNARNVSGYTARVPLVNPVRKEGWPVGRKDSLVAKYTFGHPVFGMLRKYPIRIYAFEKYNYNNDEMNEKTEIVHLAGGEVTIHNGLKSSTHHETISLDENGEYIYDLEASQTPYILTGDEALRTVSMTLKRDGVYYEAEPLDAFVLNQIAKAGAKDVLSINKPVLVDILRDPPGGTSSATLTKGSTLKASFKLNMKASYGFTLDFAIGTQWNTWQGIGAGVYQAAGKDFTFNNEVVWSNNSDRAYSYTMTANTDISTSSDPTMVGAMADVYMGMETNIFLRPTISIRAIPDSTYQQLKGEEAAGRLVVIANGTDTTGDPLYLVRDEVVSLGQTVTSTFVHSQYHIINEVIPNLLKQTLSLMFTGTKAEAQQQANATGQPVYLSLRNTDDENFAMMNSRKENGQWVYYYNTTQETAVEGTNYLIVLPNGWSVDDKTDLVHEFCESLVEWCNIIGQNEYEKLSANTLMRNFDVDGGSPISYSESFNSELSYTSSNHNISTDYQYGGEGIAANIFSSGSLVPLNSLFASGITLLEKQLMKKIVEYFGGGYSRVDPSDTNPEHETVVGTGWKFDFSMLPIIECTYMPTNSTSSSYSRKESFKIGMDRKSHLNFDVYYVETPNPKLEAFNWNDVFVNAPFVLMDQTVMEEVYSNLSSFVKSGSHLKRGFVYRTRGGATCRPWEDERTTAFYNSGTVLDERTKKIENPVMTLDKQSISGVPFGEPARFKLYLANDSEDPTLAYPYWNLSLKETSNPNGAKLMIDGMPLTGTPRTVEIVPGHVTEKTIEVYAGEEFDYENLSLRLCSQGDPNTYYDAEFSVHYLRTAGYVEISMPGDKWILNTDAPYDSINGWHMPVIISGYNKNQNNFDHIELQYKETNRGDDYWTNLCSFYADSTYYVAASGTKAMIPENGYINTKFYGEGEVMEKAYDLRAVLFCRNGNGYITTISKVVSGVKDTRRPQLFGYPEPKDGVLAAGDNIIFNFTEDIEYNYLREATNFEVLGETNETAISEQMSLLFDGDGYAQSDVKRNFADKDVSVEVMIKPEDTGKDMPIFSHGTYGKQLQLWITADKHLKAVVDDKTLVSDSTLNIEGFNQVALVLNNDAKTLQIFGPGIENMLEDVSYSGYGPLIFGSTNQTDVNKRTYYQGRMLEGRIWYRTMDAILLNTYGYKRLTGYEMGLTDYYPMDEGSGDYATDLAQGAHLTLYHASWAQPRGMSLSLNRDEDRTIKGLKLKSKYFMRTSEEDYTLMFWFKTNLAGRGALLSNGSGRTNDVLAENKFFIGFEAEQLKYRSNGMEYVLGTTESDNAWHHFAMTVNRAYQVANIYIDNNLRTSFSTENLGGMEGDDFYLGNMVWHEKGDNTSLQQDLPLTGNIDGICLFQQALPPTLIKRYSKKSVGGEEKGLITFLGFDEQKRQLNHDYTLQPYALNQKVYYDLDGNITELRDTVFVDSVSYVLEHIDRNVGAPIEPYEYLRNLNFSYAGRSNQLMVNIDELDSRINKRTVYVTLYDIPDLNGNYSPSPYTAAVFVDRNPLRWGQKVCKLTRPYNAEEDYEFDVSIINESGAAHTYTIENLPKWLSISTLQDVIDAKSEDVLTFTINKDTNVGLYDDIIYLTDENGLSEPLVLNITIEGEVPDWTVDADMKQYSMNLVGRVMIGEDIVTDTRDIIAAFDANGNCMGRANVTYTPESGEALVYMSIFSEKSKAINLNFRLWHYLTGKIYVLTPSEAIEFIANQQSGTPKNPILLQAGDNYVQEIALKKGWNWISFNVYNNNFRDAQGINTLLSQFNWSNGDLWVDATNKLMLAYQDGGWISNKADSTITVGIGVTHSYMVHVASAMNVEVTGSSLKDTDSRTITVDKGWNYIGYTPMVNLPVSTALSEYFDDAKDGDMVKNQTEFATMTEGANGSKEWKGNLQYMKPGEGYMLLRHSEGQAKFTYPYYEPNATFFENTGASAFAPRMYMDYANTMTLTAVVEGIDIQEGDRLVAYSEDEVRGDAPVAIDEDDDNLSPTYMSINGDKQAPLAFAIERDGEIIAMTDQMMTYEVNGVSGSPLHPTRINFLPADMLAQHGWYTLQGIKLAKRPSKSGVYIYNGKKQVIK